MWAAETDTLLGRMAGQFARVETRRRTRGFLLGLLAPDVSVAAAPAPLLGTATEPGHTPTLTTSAPWPPAEVLDAAVGPDD